MILDIFFHLIISINTHERKLFYVRGFPDKKIASCPGLQYIITVRLWTTQADIWCGEK
jgi:hypothetical protein